MKKISKTDLINKEENVNELIINGVSVTSLSKSKEAVKIDETMSQFKFIAKGRWISGAYNQTSINEYYGACKTHQRKKPFVYEMDEPQVLSGNDIAANPLEYLLIALNGCLTTALVYHASAHLISLDEVESTLEGNINFRGTMGLSDDIRKGYENIKVKFKVKSSAPREKINELIKLAQRYSPVFDVISNPTKIDISLEE